MALQLLESPSTWVSISTWTSLQELTSTLIMKTTGLYFLKYTQLLVSFNPTTLFTYISKQNNWQNMGFLKRLQIYLRFNSLKLFKSKYYFSWSPIQFKISFHSSGLSMKYVVKINTTWETTLKFLYWQDFQRF